MREEQGKETILPLNVKELRRYVKTSRFNNSLFLLSNGVSSSVSDSTLQVAAPAPRASVPRLFSVVWI